MMKQGFNFSRFLAFNPPKLKKVMVINYGSVGTGRVYQERVTQVNPAIFFMLSCAIFSMCPRLSNAAGNNTISPCRIAGLRGLVVTAYRLLPSV